MKDPYRNGGSIITENIEEPPIFNLYIYSKIQKMVFFFLFYHIDILLNVWYSFHDVHKKKKLFN